MYLFKKARLIIAIVSPLALTGCVGFVADDGYYGDGYYGDGYYYDDNYTGVYAPPIVPFIGFGRDWDDDWHGDGGWYGGRWHGDGHPVFRPGVGVPGRPSGIGIGGGRR